MTSTIQTKNGDELFESNIIEDPLKKYKKLYWIFPLLVAVALLIEQFNPVAGVLGVGFGLLLAYMVFEVIALVKLLKLNFTNYPLANLISDEQLYEYLQSTFSNPEIIIKKGLFGLTFVYKNTTSHTVYINEKKMTLSIRATTTLKSRLKRGGKGKASTEYRNAYFVVPIIKKAVVEAALALR